MKKIKRIAIVIPKYGLIGGAEFYAAQLAERIAEDPFYDIHVFANRWSGNSNRITFHKVPIITFPKYLTTISFAYFAQKKISKMNFDLIHAHDRIFNADIFTMHGIPHRLWVKDIRKKKHLSLFDRATAWVEKRLVTIGGCKTFLAVSELTKQKFLKEYSLPDPERIRVLHPGVELERFIRPDRKECRDRIRERFGFSADDIVILFASMNFDIRGLDHLIRGLAMVKSRNPAAKIKLLVVGKGKPEPYARIAGSLGIGADVVFAGIFQKTEMAEVLFAADIFSILSLFDTFSITVLEAMAASLPVIISGNMGIKDLIQQCTNGMVVHDISDPDQVSEKIELLLDASIRERMGAKAFETARLQDWSFVAQKIDQIYKSILGEQK
jgi:UDP-glucose:(heptosyl)LPS alpha-1,3-glucosyltransferase